MYPRNAASPERIAIGAVVQISDGAVQTSGCTITVRGQGGAEATGGGTTAYGASGIVYYTPTQAETDFTSFAVIASKTGCVPISQTIVTTASATPGTVLLAPVTHTSAVVPTVSTLTGHTAQTGDAFARLGAPAGASISADVAAVKVDTAAILVDTGTTLQAELDGIQADTEDIQARLPAALVGGRIDATVDGTGMEAGAVTAIQSGLATAAALATVDANVDNLVSGIIFGAAATGTLSTTQASSDLTGYGNDQLIGRPIIWLTGACEGEASTITDYVSTSGVLTFDALTTAPGNGDTFKIV